MLKDTERRTIEPIHTAGPDATKLSASCEGWSKLSRLAAAVWTYSEQTYIVQLAFSALTLLAGRQEGIRPVKNRVVGCWRGADLLMARLMPLPLTVSCFSKIQIGFTFLVPAHPGSPGQRAVKRVCVCVYSVQFASTTPTRHDGTKQFSRVESGNVDWVFEITTTVRSSNCCTGGSGTFRTPLYSGLRRFVCLVRTGA